MAVPPDDSEITSSMPAFIFGRKAANGFGAGVIHQRRPSSSLPIDPGRSWRNGCVPCILSQSPGTETPTQKSGTSFLAGQEDEAASQPAKQR